MAAHVKGCCTLPRPSNLKRSAFVNPHNARHKRSENGICPRRIPNSPSGERAPIPIDAAAVAFSRRPLSPLA